MCMIDTVTTFHNVYSPIASSLLTSLAVFRKYALRTMNASTSDVAGINTHTLDATETTMIAATLHDNCGKRINSYYHSCGDMTFKCKQLASIHADRYQKKLFLLGRL